MEIPKTKLAKITEIVGEAALFLAGVVAGIIFSIFGLAILATKHSPMGAISPIFQFPTVYYVVVILVMVGLSVLLRAAARRMPRIIV